MYELVRAAFECSGIFCASKRPDNFLLWAHYAERNKGAVLEFQPNLELDSMLLLAEEVTYTSQRPHLYESHNDFLNKSMFRDINEILKEYTEKITKTKHLAWACEEEIRPYQPMLVNLPEGENYQLLNYHAGELKSADLNFNVGVKKREGISELAFKRNSQVKIYEMIPMSTDTNLGSCGIRQDQ